jgi:hypothetical protein
MWYTALIVVITIAKTVQRTSVPEKPLYQQGIVFVGSANHKGPPMDISKEQAI